MAYTFNQKNWIVGEVITANGVNRIEECLGHLVDDKQDILYFDALPTAGSQNLVNSGGIYNALKALDNFTIDRRPSPDSRNAVQSRGIYEALLGKQDLLIFDSTPKSSSSNPVTSQGIYQALNLKQNNLTFDNTPINNSNNPVTSNGVYQALLLKQNNLTFDSIPILNSNHPVTSNGVYQSLLLKQDNLTFDISPSLNSNNPVTSEGIYISLQNLSNELNVSLENLSNNLYQALNLKQNNLTFDISPSLNSNNPVTSNGIYNALQEIELKIPDAQVQSDWNITDSASKAYIKNKPSLGTAAYKNIPSSGNASSIQVVLGNDTRLSDSRNAKDVYNWAKQPEKPIYSYEEITGSPIQEQSDWEEKDIESKAYIKNKPEWIYSDLSEEVYSFNGKIFCYNVIDHIYYSRSFNPYIQLFEDKKYGIIINNKEYLNLYLEKIGNYYCFIGGVFHSLDKKQVIQNGFGVVFRKEDENLFYIVEIDFTESIIQNFLIFSGDKKAPLINKQYLDIPEINFTIKNDNNLVTSGAIYQALIKKQDNLINVPEISEIKSTDYIYIERNKTIYKILASKLGTFTPDESDPNAIETNDGNIITDENGNEIIIDNNSDSDPNAVETNNGNVILDENGNEIIINTNTTDTVVTNDDKVILTEDQRELNLG